jgi:hypothetical protein
LYLVLLETHLRHRVFQFPDKMETLVPVTQLYISVDAANKDSLQAVDRPLFKDFWERFLSCIDVLKAKGQRTVRFWPARLSLALRDKFNVFAGVPHDASEAAQYGRSLRVSFEFELCRILLWTACWLSICMPDLTRPLQVCDSCEPRHP